MTSSNHASPTGILLVNLGTPEAPTAAALRRYLGEFLWDPRVVQIPRPLWWLILHGVVLTTRPRKSAHAYARVWTAEGSPLLVFARQQALALQAYLTSRGEGTFKVALGMRYGAPAMAEALRTLRGAGCRRLIVLPLYPQYAGATTASTFDALAAEFKNWPWLPATRFIADYHQAPAYIAALAASVTDYWRAHGTPDKLVLSFHGLPARSVEEGDPYYHQCLATAGSLAARLGLPEERWVVTFQSRFGREKWLQPYTDATLKSLAGEGIGRVDVVCPGFSADCLETLEEIALLNRATFLTAGGREYHYIPALNDRPDHIAALAEIILQHAGDWGRPPDAISSQPVGEAPRGDSPSL